MWKLYFSFFCKTNESIPYADNVENDYIIYIYIYITQQYIICIYIIYWQKSCKENARHQREIAATRKTPHSTAVNIALSVAWGCTHAGTTHNLCIRVRSHNFLCIYVTKQEYNQRITRLFIRIFEQMIHIASSAHQWITFIWCQWYHRPVKVLSKCH